ncbi:Alpha-N-acetylglucosaminidase [Collichthys lucidus]|uniref:1-alkyl-2-acetylglycerophosphocholine esterase n=1 Tax=Collichthys lucidus TaxID=240159 RepID=A0A4U5VQA7_COLLU|nr:Alpha-N-acetylglucosaminidase [Collichthys lucidus]
MPRGKSYRRFQAAKRRIERQESWTTSLDGNRVDGVPLALCANKKFVLVVSDSQLCALVDGFVLMAEGPLSFGFMCTSGATTAHLRAELRAAVVPRQPEAVIILAPSNNLTAGRGLENSSEDFAALLKTERSRWSNVVVLDFPPHLSVEEDQQKLLRMAYHSACADQGVPYHHICENFPLHQRDLWARDGVSSTHLSDSEGMPILAYLLWQLSLPEAELAALDKQVSQKKVELKEYFIPLTPVRFSPATLRAIEKTSPSFLPTSEEGTAVPVRIQEIHIHSFYLLKQKVAVKRRTVFAKRRLPKEQVDTVVSAVEVSHVAKTPTAVPVVDKEAQLYDMNARNQLTLWGPDGEILDYASKEWGGLMEDYYAQRWGLFVQTLIECLDSGQPFKQDTFNQAVFQVEKGFIYNGRKYPTKPQGDTYEIAYRIFLKYYPQALKRLYSHHTLRLNLRLWVTLVTEGALLRHSTFSRLWCHQDSPFHQVPDD